MSEDLYAVLDVPRDATPDKIKRAYRKKAMKAHPDRGGNAEEFKQLQRAYDVLGDPDRRKHYDDTGTVDDNVESAIERARRLAAEILVGVASQLPEDPRYMDLIGAAKDFLKQEKLATEQDLVKERAKAERMRAVSKRLTRSDKGVNMAGQAIEAQAKKSDERIAALERKLKEVADVKLEVELYVFERDKPPMPENPFMGSVKEEVLRQYADRATFQWKRYP